MTVLCQYDYQVQHLHWRLRHSHPDWLHDQDSVTSRHLFQYYETDRNYRGRRQDVLQGQFVEVRQQLEEDAEVVEDPPVPVVIKGENQAIRICW